MNASRFMVDPSRCVPDRFSVAAIPSLPLRLNNTMTRMVSDSCISMPKRTWKQELETQEELDDEPPRKPLKASSNYPLSCNSLTLPSLEGQSRVKSSAEDLINAASKTLHREVCRVDSMELRVNGPNRFKSCKRKGKPTPPQTTAKERGNGSSNSSWAASPLQSASGASPSASMLLSKKNHLLDIVDRKSRPSLTSSGVSDSCVSKPVRAPSMMLPVPSRTMDANIGSSNDSTRSLSKPMRAPSMTLPPPVKPNTTTEDGTNSDTSVPKPVSSETIVPSPLDEGSGDCASEAAADTIAASTSQSPSPSDVEDESEDEDEPTIEETKLTKSVSASTIKLLKDRKNRSTKAKKKKTKKISRKNDRSTQSTEDSNKSASSRSVQSSNSRNKSRSVAKVSLERALGNMTPSPSGENSSRSKRSVGDSIVPSSSRSIQSGTSTKSKTKSQQRPKSAKKLSKLERYLNGGSEPAGSKEMDTSARSSASTSIRSKSSRSKSKSKPKSKPKKTRSNRLSALERVLGAMSPKHNSTTSSSTTSSTTSSSGGSSTRKKLKEVKAKTASSKKISKRRSIGEIPPLPKKK
mmetsp:Transcript_33560/g.79138  ORF Transcript_33560/g.79138 Transcript_33560/m.79138 type:complete len:578 (+) Transcript_33560:165-1898(+)